MKLDEYLFFAKKKKKEFAKELGISPEHLSGIITGKRRSSPGLSKKIASLTEGKVSASEVLFPEEFH